MQSAFNGPDARRWRIIPGSKIRWLITCPSRLAPPLGNKPVRSAIFLDAAAVAAAPNCWRAFTMTEHDEPLAVMPAKACIHDHGLVSMDFGSSQNNNGSSLQFQLPRNRSSVEVGSMSRTRAARRFPGSMETLGGLPQP